MEIPWVLIRNMLPCSTYRPKSIMSTVIYRTFIIPVSSGFSESRRLHFIAPETVGQTTPSCSMTTFKQETNSLTDLWKLP